MNNKQVHIRLSQEEHKALRILCIQMGTSIQDLVHKVIMTFMNENKNRCLPFIKTNEKED
jgi:predicted transcriptional regulator YheO